MHFSMVALALASVAASSAVVPLPVPAVPRATVPGVSSIVDSIHKLSSELNFRADQIVTANVKISSNVSANAGPALELSKAVGGATLSLWEAAYDVEKKVCALASSLNAQNVEIQKANLIAGVYAQINSVVKITLTLQTTIEKLGRYASALTSAEKSVLEATIKSLISSASAAGEPVGVFAAGAKTVGAGFMDS
ncbi:hypothetical protein K504DRAFT_496075 [Pleomassaria siparia CBS 279.74]|uniref:Cell wall protein n=1 Tax=Pleomassaria siparia CBS 279.74 TaxID=1314801 RepID=A0A6G1JR80_9PLEO|nr:hypothetical protein K504DRAFT_496075 [Pleomassaria siparia CBS 279.74]